jgi:hypothetical protein
MKSYSIQLEISGATAMSTLLAHAAALRPEQKLARKFLGGRTANVPLHRFK